MALDYGDILFLGLGATVLLPLGARIAGNRHLARRLDLIPRFTFAIVSLTLAFSSQSAFVNLDTMHRITGPADSRSGRIFFAVFGLFLIVTGIRIILRRDFDNPDDNEELR